MPLFFFHVRNGEAYMPDDLGVELKDVAMARQQALQAAKATLIQAIKDDELVDGQEFEVCDAAGELVFNCRSARRSGCRTSVSRTGP